MTKRAIIYTRMSVYSPQFTDPVIRKQRKACKEYCNANQIKVAHIMEEYNEAKTFNRPEWNKVMEMIEFNPKRVDMVVVQSWGFLSRDIEQLRTLKRKLDSLGVELINVKFPSADIFSDKAWSLLMIINIINLAL